MILICYGILTFFHYSRGGDGGGRGGGGDRRGGGGDRGYYGGGGDRGGYGRRSPSPYYRSRSRRDYRSRSRSYSPRKYLLRSSLGLIFVLFFVSFGENFDGFFNLRLE